MNDFACIHCEKSLPEKAKFCPACGRTQDPNAPKMGRPPKPDHVRLVAYMSKEAADEIRRLASLNDMTLGEIIITFSGLPIVTTRKKEE